MMVSPADQAAEIARLKRELDRARMERDILKSGRHLRGGAPLRFEFIRPSAAFPTMLRIVGTLGCSAHAGVWPVRVLCRVLGVSPSGHYDWRDRPEGVRAKANRALLGDVHRLQARHHGRYGSPCMHTALRAEGHVAAERVSSG